MLHKISLISLFNIINLKLILSIKEKIHHQVSTYSSQLPLNANITSHGLIDIPVQYEYGQPSKQAIDDNGTNQISHVISVNFVHENGTVSRTNHSICQGNKIGQQSYI
ncbi:hypothetical protein FRX31_033419, partial [Thalictrum thalictroides]